MVHLFFFALSSGYILVILLGFVQSLELPLLFFIFLLEFLQLHFSFIYDGFILSLFVETIDQTDKFRVGKIIFVLEIHVFWQLSVGFKVLIFLWGSVLLGFVVEGFFLFLEGAVVEILKFFSFFFKFLGYHWVIFDNFTLEILSVSQSLLNFFLQVILILYFLAAVCNKFLGKFFHLINFFLELENWFTFSFNHLFEVVAFKDEIRNGLFVVSFISSADFYQNIQSFVFKEGVCILVLNFFNFLFNFVDFFLLLLDFLLVF